MPCRICGEIVDLTIWQFNDGLCDICVGKVIREERKCLYIIAYALSLSNKKMLKSNLNFILSKYGLKVIESGSPQPEAELLIIQIAKQLGYSVEIKWDDARIITLCEEKTIKKETNV